MDNPLTNIWVWVSFLVVLVVAEIIFTWPSGGNDDGAV